MEKHRGEIVEYRVRKNGFNISELSNQLNMSRRSLYNWFALKDLKTDYIYRIGLIIRHDFSIDFPEHFTQEEFSSITASVGMMRAYVNQQVEDPWKDKYLVLLEQYNALLKVNMERLSTPVKIAG
jgi:lambda repressor-like predicted transcriptional regulator